MKDVFLLPQVPNATHPPETQKLLPVSPVFIDDFGQDVCVCVRNRTHV